MTVTQTSTGTVFVVRGYKEVYSAEIIDNAKWGEGFLTVIDENRTERIVDTERCFRNESGAEDAAYSKAICRQFGIHC